jgi:hypothetical protein
LIEKSGNDFPQREFGKPNAARAATPFLSSDASGRSALAFPSSLRGYVPFWAYPGIRPVLFYAVPTGLFLPGLGLKFCWGVLLLTFAATCCFISGIPKWLSAYCDIRHILPRKIRSTIRSVPESTSREAAQECSPGRKPWVKRNPEQALKGRKKRGTNLRQCRGASDLQHQTA